MLGEQTLGGDEDGLGALGHGVGAIAQVHRQAVKGEEGHGEVVR
jgi:hypothetical protein